MRLDKKFLRIALLTLFAINVPLDAVAQVYPTKPIRMIIPFAAGGITDSAGRLIAERLSIKLGKPVIVDNRGGGGSRIGADMAAKSVADGYTLLYANSSSHASLVATSKDLPYDPIKDFAHIVQAFSYPSVLVCGPNVPYNNVQELIEYAKKNPDVVTNGSAGKGSGNHFMNELFNSMANVKITHVPYRGSSQALIDTLAGTTSCTFDGSSKQFVDTGKLKAIAVTGLVRDPRFPTVPTLNEAGLKGYNIVTWQGLVAPKGTPEGIVQKLNQAVSEILQEPTTRAKAAELGLMLGGGTPEKFRTTIQEDIARYQKISKDANLTFD